MVSSTKAKVKAEVWRAASQRDCHEQRFKDIGVVKSLYRRSFKTTEHNKETGGLRKVSDQ